MELDVFIIFQQLQDKFSYFKILVTYVINNIYFPVIYRAFIIGK